MILAPSSSETLNYVVWLVRSSLQHGGWWHSFIRSYRSVSFSCQVGESPLWITRHNGLQYTMLLGEEEFSFLNVISPFYLITLYFFILFF